MSRIIACPSCGKSVSAPESCAGQRVRCPKCRTVFRLPAAEQSAEAEPLAIVERPSGAVAEVQAEPIAEGVAPPRKGFLFLSGLATRRLAWVLCFPWTFGVALVFILMLGGGHSAIQEAAIAATACFAVIAPFVLARAVEGMTAP